MTAGVFCEIHQKKMTFDECATCAKCLPAPVIKSLKIYDYAPQRSVYYLKEVIGCLRKAYLARKSGQADEYLTLKRLYAIKRGKTFGAMVDASRWKELDGSLTYKIDGEEVKLTARLDAYDPQTGTIVELKSLELWSKKPETQELWKKKLPYQKDVLQVQGYGTIFKHIMPVGALKVLYLDMNEYAQFDVPPMDMEDWLQARVLSLHRALRDSKPPTEDPCFECRFCEHEKSCDLMPLASTANSSRRTVR